MKRQTEKPVAKLSTENVSMILLWRNKDERIPAIQFCGPAVERKNAA
jgi:hypothetical protein